MYLVINRFLLRNQFLDLQKVPDFFKLFYSFDQEVPKFQISAITEMMNLLMFMEFLFALFPAQTGARMGFERVGGRDKR